MKIHKIDEVPLSLAPEFGEVTISSYLEGQVPSKEYLDVVRAALASPAYMKQKLSLLLHFFLWRGLESAFFFDWDMQRRETSNMFR